MISLLSSLSVAALDAPVPLISPRGDFQPAAASELASVGGARSVVATVGGRLRARRLLNSIFATEFDTARAPAAGEDRGGAYVAASPQAPELLLVHTEAASAGEACEDGAVADESAFGCFALGLADAVLVLPPCAEPTRPVLVSAYEEIFAQLAATAEPTDGKRTLLVHLAQTAADDAAIKSAAMDAWAAACGGGAEPSFDSRFELTAIALPSSAVDADAFSAGATELRTRLRTLARDGFGTPIAATEVAARAEAVWLAVQSAASGRPGGAALRERYQAARAYEASMEAAVLKLRPLSAAVAKGRVIDGFGAAADSLLNGTLAHYDDAVADVSGITAELVARRRAILSKQLQADVKELFSKQQRSLARSVCKRYERQLLAVMERAGNVAQYQRDRLRKNAERAYDAQVASLIVPSLGGPTRAQLTQSFSAQLTAFADRLVESPSMQLQALGATRRRVSKPAKPPKGLRWGLALTGAMRTKWGGGGGNLQTFAGYQTPDGMWSAHGLLANDGAIADSSGSEPPPLRMQPKLNVDLSL